MIVEYLRYAVEPARAGAFRTAYLEAAAILQADPRCLAYEVAQGREDPTQFVVRTEWDSIEGHVQGFRSDPASGAFSALVGPFAEDLVETQHYDVHVLSPDLPEKGLPSLYDWAGGREAIGRMLDAFYDRVEEDELLAPFFPGGVTAEHRDAVTTWWSEVLGGPADYTPAGGYPRMVAHHLELDIGVEPRRRFVALLSVAADDADLPADPEFRAALVGYAEWATRLAMHNSKIGADVVRVAPVPRWGWGVAPPYLG